MHTAAGLTVPSANQNNAGSTEEGLAVTISHISKHRRSLIGEEMQGTVTHGALLAHDRIVDAV